MRSRRGEFPEGCRFRRFTEQPRDGNNTTGSRSGVCSKKTMPSVCPKGGFGRTSCSQRKKKAWHLEVRVFFCAESTEASRRGNSLLPTLRTNLFCYPRVKTGLSVLLNCTATQCDIQEHSLSIMTCPREEPPLPHLLKCV